MLSFLRPPLELLGMIGGYLVVGLALVWLLGPLTGMIAVHLAVIVLWLVLRLRARRTGTPLRRPDGQERRDLTGRQWLTALSATIVIWASAQIIAAWIHAQNEAFGAQLPSDESIGYLGVLLALALAVVFAPLGEELLLRGMVYGRMRRAYSPVLAGLITAGVFALLHGNLVQIVLTFPIGVLFAAVIEVSGRLRITIALHGVFNMLSVFGPTGGIRAAAAQEWIVLLCIPILLVTAAAATRGLLASAKQPDRARTGT